MRTVYHGCYADGAFGHSHVRDVLADLVEDALAEDKHAPADERTRLEALVDELRGPQSDDAGEEDEALDYLNTRYQTHDACFHFDGGDLLFAVPE